jgi:hypothetical protein
MAIITAFEAMYYLEQGAVPTPETGTGMEFFIAWFEGLPFRGPFSPATRLLAWGTMQYLARIPPPASVNEAKHRRVRSPSRGLTGVAERRTSFIFPPEIDRVSIYFPIMEWPDHTEHLTDVSTLTVKAAGETAKVIEIVWSQFDSQKNHFTAAWGVHTYHLIITGAAGLPREVAPLVGEIDPPDVVDPTDED